MIQHRHIRMHNRQLERADCRALVDTVVQKRPQHSNRSPQRQRAVSAPTCSLGVKVQLRCQRAASAPTCSIGANVQSQHQRQPQCTLASRRHSVQSRRQCEALAPMRSLRSNAPSSISPQAFADCSSTRRCGLDDAAEHACNPRAAMSTSMGAGSTVTAS